MTVDIDFYVDLAPQREGPLVGLAVGNGRVAVSVAKPTGETVIGVDSSPSMLERTRFKALGVGVQLSALGRHAGPQPWGASGADLLPFAGLFHLPTWADRRLERSPAPWPRGDASPGTPSSLIISSPPGWVVNARTLPSALTVQKRRGQQPHRPGLRGRRDRQPLVGNHERVARAAPQSGSHGS